MNVRAWLCGCGLLAASLAASAQGYPNRPIQVIVPLAVGSAGDALLRMVAQELSTSLKQQLIVDNQPGAAGLVGAERLTRAAPDGYTLGGLSDSVVNYAPSLAAKLNFNPLTDFEPISFLAGVSWVLVIHPSLPARNLTELIELMKARGDKLDYASAGNGSPHHIVMELFKVATGTQVRHIPYRGATQATTDVVAGQVPMMFSGLSVAAPFIKDGKLRAPAVLGTARAGLLPDVPTMAEAGLPGFTFDTWVGMYAPKGVPPAIIAQLNAEVGKALANPALRQRLVALGFEPRHTTPAELAARTRDGLQRVAKVVRDANIKAD